MVVFVSERVNYKTAFEKKILKYVREMRYYRHIKVIPDNLMYREQEDFKPIDHI